MEPIKKKGNVFKQRRHGRLFVSERIVIKGKAFYKVICDCGTEKLISVGTLSKAFSCGCLQRELTVQRMTKHGLSKTDEYSIWCGIKSRCYNKKELSYKRYGALGIKLSDDWLNFENFYRDMGERPSKNHSIDRVNNKLGYTKENCRWADRITQANNKDRNHLVSFNGKTQTLAQWATELNVSYGTIKMRVKNGKNVLGEKL